MSIFPKIKEVKKAFKDYYGHQILDVPEDTVIEVLDSPSTKNANVGDYILRRSPNDLTHPLETISSADGSKEKGDLWGNMLSGYRFRAYFDKESL